MDIYGGKGIIMGLNNYLGCFWQGVLIFIMVEGVNIFLCNLMIFGQGVICCYLYVFKEMELVQCEDKDQVVCEFDVLLVKYIGFVVGNVVSSFFFSFSCGYFGNVFGDCISCFYFCVLNCLVVFFVLFVDFSMMLLGGELKCKECFFVCFGDVFSYFYLGLVVFKCYYDLGNLDYLYLLLCWVMEENFGKVEVVLEDLLNNFFSCFFGCVLKVLVLLFGCWYKGLGDELDVEIVEIFGCLDDDLVLQVIFVGVFLLKDLQDLVGVFVYVFDVVCESVVLEKILYKVIKEGRVQL